MVEIKPFKGTRPYNEDAKNLIAPKDTPYGTIEMAKCVQKMFPDKNHGTFAMAGHEDGVIAFAPNLDKAGDLILELHDVYHS